MAHEYHPVRGRLNCWFLAAAEEAMHREYGERKRRIFGDIPPEVVELGPGSGANFRYYPPDTRVIAIEPNPAMHRRMRRQAERHGIELDVRHVGAEGMEVPDASVGLVVSTFVLCTVEDPQEAVSEVRRILRPGGRFAFLEHVAARPGTALRAVQETIRRPWRWLGEGCVLTRRTAESIRGAGFRELDLERFDGPRWTPFRPHIAGYAVR